MKVPQRSHLALIKVKKNLFSTVTAASWNPVIFMENECFLYRIARGLNVLLNSISFFQHQFGIWGMLSLEVVMKTYRFFKCQECISLSHILKE